MKLIQILTNLLSLRLALSHLEINSQCLSKKNNYLLEQYTLYGQNQIPSLSLGGIQQDFFAVLLYDKSASNFVHWFIYNVSKSNLSEFQRIINQHENSFAFADEMRNDFGNIGYGGPKPPNKDPHDYVFVLY